MTFPHVNATKEEIEIHVKEELKMEHEEAIDWLRSTHVGGPHSEREIYIARVALKQLKKIRGY